MEYANDKQHDEINLARLVRRLEKSVANGGEWDEASEQHQDRTWLKAQGGLQKVKYARKLVNNVESHDTDASPHKIKQLNDTKIKLDRVEIFLNEVQKRTAPTPLRPEPILPQIPIPSPEADESPSLGDGGLLSPSDTPEARLPESSSEDLLNVHRRRPSENLLLSSAETSDFPLGEFVSPIPSLIPSHPSDTPTVKTSFSSALRAESGPTPRKNAQTSNALQEELSTQLEQMAAQLKRNAMHFSQSLANDQAVVEDAQQKIEGNFDFMHKERIRLRDHRGKSGSTTCLVVVIVIVVLLLFMLMVSVIRLS